MSLDAYWPLYPDALKASQWTKHKGIVAKIVKSDTGIGQALTETEAMFDKLPAHLYSRVSVPTDTKAECLDALNKANAGFNGPMKAFFDKLLKVKQLATTQEAIFAKKVLIPKSTTAYVKKIADAAQGLTDTLRNHCIHAIADIKKDGSAATK